MSEIITESQTYLVNLLRENSRSKLYRFAELGVSNLVGRTQQKNRENTLYFSTFVNVTQFGEVDQTFCKLMIPDNIIFEGLTISENAADLLYPLASYGFLVYFERIMSRSVVWRNFSFIKPTQYETESFSYKLYPLNGVYI